MSTLEKHRLFDVKRILIYLFFLVGMFVYWLFASGMIYMLIGFDTGAPDLAGQGEAARQSMIAGNLTMDTFTDIINYGVCVFPFLIFAMAAFFYKEKDGMFTFRYTRGQSQKRVVLSTLLNYALTSAVCFYLCYLIYMTIGYFLCGPTMGLERGAFDGVFGAGFSTSHVYCYYLIEGFFKYFLAAFVYTLFACSIALVTHKIYSCVLIPACYYYGLTLLFMVCSAIHPLICFQPAYIEGFNAYMYDNPSVFTLFQISASLLIPLLISIVLIVYTLKRRERTC